MELRHIRYFLVLAEELHFGRAAKRLFISQPPLSRQIKELEDELGVILFLRDNKRVSLTEAGHYFMREAVDMTQRLDIAKKQVLRIHQSLAGDVKIGYISATNKQRLGLLVQELQASHPFLQIKLYELSSEKQIEALRLKQLDIGIIRAPVTSADIRVETLYEEGFSLVHAMNFDLPTDLSALTTIPFISYHADYAPIYHQHMLAYCAQLGFSPNLQHACNNIASILELVHLNRGISVVPQSVQSQYRHLAINFLNLVEPSIKTSILLAYTKEQPHPAFSIIRDLVNKIFRV